MHSSHCYASRRHPDGRIHSELSPSRSKKCDTAHGHWSQELALHPPSRRRPALRHHLLLGGLVPAPRQGPARVSARRPPPAPGHDQSGRSHAAHACRSAAVVNLTVTTRPFGVDLTVTSANAQLSLLRVKEAFGRTHTTIFSNQLVSIPGPLEFRTTAPPNASLRLR